MTENTNNNIILYQTPDGAASLEVHLDHETVWLTQKQMAELFGKDLRTVNEHLINIFREGELEESSVIRKFRITAADGKSYDTAHYSLDVIISVGYRVKSHQGTRFRQWATLVLRDHIVKGYTINEQRFREQAEKLTEMQRTVTLLARKLANQELVSDTGKDVLRVITDYAYALNLLDRYDHGTLAIEGTTRQALHVIDYDEAIGIVTAMKGEFYGLFGNEKDQGFKSTLGAIYQTFGGEELYPSVEEKGQISSTSSSRTMPSATATNGSPPPVYLLPRHESHPLPTRRQQTLSRQCPGGADAPHCREPTGREGNYRQGHRQSDQPEK